MIDTVRSPNDQISMTNDPGMTNVQGQMTNESHDLLPAISENRKLQTENSLPDMIPVRMLNEFTYCPRLGYLEWVEGEWASNLETMEGSFGHRRVDRPSTKPVPKGTKAKPAADGEAAADGANPETASPEPESIHSRSLMLSAPDEGLLAKLDLLELEGMTATPVDYKRGKAPNIPEGAYEPERVQICAQGLILRENGFQCDRGVLYFIGSKKRVTIEFTEELIDRTRYLRDEFRRTAAAGIMPPPLIDSPKCPRCSLVGICLPDETNLLQCVPIVEQSGLLLLEDPACDSLNTDNRKLNTPAVRKLLPANDDALPLYVQTQGAMLGKSGDRLTIKYKDELLAERRLMDVSQVSLFGNVMISAQSLRELTTRGIPVCHFTYGGWFHGITSGLIHKNVELRIRQYEIAADPVRSLRIAKWFISGKIRNSRTLLRRHLTAGGSVSDPQSSLPSNIDDSDLRTDRAAEFDRNRILESLAEFRRKAEQATSAESLLGLEGMAAKTYFAGYFAVLNGRHDFDVNDRNRRPPKDPVNAVMSFVYALLVKELTVVLQAVGFDPMLGFFHRPRYGRPSLALDVAEEYRPLIGDSVTLMAFNNGEVDHNSFLERAGAVTMTEAGRKAVIAAFERRLEQEVTHPIFGYRISYRRILEVQARLLARTITGELPEYIPFCTR